MDSPVTLSSFARIDDQDTPLVTEQPALLGDMEQNYQRLIDLPRTRIDLGRFRGKTIRVKWVVEPSDSEVEVRLMDLRLTPVRQTKPPDILLICSDTHRFDYSMGERGKELMSRLAEFAAGATTYLNSYATASWTLDSVSSLYAGRWPRFHHTGARVRSLNPGALKREMLKQEEFHIEFPDRTRIMTTFPRTMPTIQGRLREYGYRAVLINGNALYVLAGFVGSRFLHRPDLR